MKEKSKKEFKELSEEELENVNGGMSICWTDDQTVCNARGGIYDRTTCKCSVSIY